MNVLLALALLTGLPLDPARGEQESKPVQGRDEILKQDIDNAIKKLGSDVPIAVLPEGPMTIPYLES